MRVSNVLIFSLVATGMTLLLRGEVSLKNGNYFTGSKDLVYSGGFEPKIERVYNSKSSFKGIFGNGWGNEYEVYLQITGDGAAVVHEYGGGAENRFDPPGLTAVEIGRVADQLKDIAFKNNDITGEKQLEGYRDRLIRDAVFRDVEWQKYIGLKLVDRRRLSVGTNLVSNRFSYQVITVERDGYRRTFDNGRIEFFRDDGKLRQIVDKNGNYVVLTYDVPGKITIQDNLGRMIVLTENAQGLVVRLDGSGGRVATYDYNDLSELTFVRDSSGKAYRYEYDPLRRHNLVRITFPDKTTEEIAYYPLERFENVKSVKDRDGSLTEYDYNLDPKDKLHYTVTVQTSSTAPIRPGAKRRIISTSSYEYLNFTKPSGEEYTASQITTIDGERTETIYNANGLPIRIARGSDESLFEYDDKGHVVRKQTPTTLTEVTYDPLVSKVTSVRVTARSAQSNQNELHMVYDPATRSSKIVGQGLGEVTDDAHFQYDEKGNLLTASSKDKSVRLKYDSAGRISEMTASDGRKLSFEYNRDSKPTKISVIPNEVAPNARTTPETITVTYDDDGNILKTESPNGREAALSVTSAFQELMDLIRPAGVTLSF